jgi:hypothetical protein
MANLEEVSVIIEAATTVDIDGYNFFVVDRDVSKGDRRSDETLMANFFNVEESATIINNLRESNRVKKRKDLEYAAFEEQALAGSKTRIGSFSGAHECYRGPKCERSARPIESCIRGGAIEKEKNQIEECRDYGRYRKYRQRSYQAATPAVRDTMRWTQQHHSAFVVARILYCSRRPTSQASEVHIPGLTIYDRSTFA